jgi:hypothetical protein
MSLVFQQRLFLRYFFLFKCDLFLPTQCRYRGLNLPLITLIDAPYSVGLPSTTDRPSQICQPDNTQHSQQRDIHVPGGIRTRNPRKRAAADPRLSARGRRDQRYEVATIINHKHSKQKAMQS